jgi:hypothetical protein
MESADDGADNPQLRIVELTQDHMVDHPAGAHTVLWNGPASLDVGLPDGEFVHFAVANLPPQWTLLADGHGHKLPIAVRYDGRLTVWWLPYDGPGKRSDVPHTSGMSDAERAAALQKLTQTRYQGLMDAAWGIGGWSTYRHN